MKNIILEKFDWILIQTTKNKAARCSELPYPCFASPCLYFISVSSLSASLPSTSLPSLWGRSIVLIANVLVGHPTIPNSFFIQGEDGRRLMETERHFYILTNRMKVIETERKKRETFIYLKEGWEPAVNMICYMQYLWIRSSLSNTCKVIVANPHSRILICFTFYSNHTSTFFFFCFSPRQ